jgi:cysteine-S-conjugate beta-lyase
MSHDFDILPDRRHTESIKWRNFDEDVIPMWIADMDFRSPEPVIRALHERVEHGIFGYPIEEEEIRQVLVERMMKKYSWEITPDDIVLLPGVVTGLNLVSHAVKQVGMGVLYQTPIYPPFLSVPENTGMTAEEAEMTRKANGSYEIDWTVFENAFSNKTGIFNLCNPYNPVGRVYTRTELEKIAEICLRHKVLICSDEIHCDLIYSGNQHIPIASLSPEISQSTITLMAPSKTYNIAGLVSSFAIVTNPELRDKICRANKGIMSFVNVLGLTALLAAYRDGQPWLDELLKYLEGNRDYLFDYVHSEMNGVSMAKPEGTYLAWLNCQNTRIQGVPQKFFLEKARVGLNDGTRFGRGGEGFVRLNFGCPRSMLAEALERMNVALKGL